jgi:hypothetical protein
MTRSGRVEQLRVEARCARDRDDLYAAKMYGLRPTTIARQPARAPLRTLRKA